MSTPGSYYGEAERLMTSLTPSDSGDKYIRAGDLFREAGRAYAAVNNFERAGDSYRHVADCLLHASKPKEACTAACDAGKAYARKGPLADQSAEAFQLAVRVARDVGEQMLTLRVIRESIAAMKTLRRKDLTLTFHQYLVEENSKSGNVRDRNKEEVTVGEILVELKRWNDALEWFMRVFNEWIIDEPMDVVLNWALCAVLCRFAEGAVMPARKMVDTITNDCDKWEGSGQSKLIKEIQVALVQKHYGELEGIGKKYAEGHTVPSVFSPLFAAVSAAFSVQPKQDDK